MLIILRILRLRHNDATDFIAMEVLTDPHLTLILFPTQGHHNPVTTGGSGFLNTRQD